MNIVVLCGGVSSEREISLRSSVKVAKALRGNGHRVQMIDVFFGSSRPLSFDEDQDFDQIVGILREKTDLITKERIEQASLFGPHVLDICRQADVVFIGLHGENGEDGKVQAAFDKEGIPYTGSDAKSSAIAMSKERTKDIVSPHIRMPKGVVIHRKDAEHNSNIKALMQGIQVPCVLKPSNGGSSLGVILVKHEDMVEEALWTCFHYDDTILLEEFVDGRELTQGVLDGVALPPVEICPEEGTWYDYSNKYNGQTREVCPAPLEQDVLERMSELSVKFGNLLGLSVYYRIDYILDRFGELYALEANSLPGMTDTSLVPQEAAAIGMSYPELCEKVIELSLKVRKQGK